ncbi:MAG: chorismate mutase [Bacillales bacterium]|nr:chorismate mutase [Bacillales bacterium]
MKNDELVELRNQIDQIDEKMADLFAQRMRIVKQVGEFKKTNNMPILDKERENIVIEKGNKLIKDENLKKYYQEFLIDLMDISKKYQNE